ncbi:hypothetical protein JCM10207_005879 [Rhodosporidiobolus poonsookiae]
MSFSDLTRSLTTLPPSSTVTSSSSIPTSSSTSRAASYTPTPVIPSTTASLGPSGVPGNSIAAYESGQAAKLSNSSGGGPDLGLALGLGLGLGIAALLAVFATLFVVRQRRSQRAEFDQRADKIKSTMSDIQTRQVDAAQPARQLAEE